MILKTKDSREQDVQELKRLLSLNISAKQRFLIERELKYLSSGIRNEDNSAYYIDFAYKDSKNSILIHDLRLEHRGRVAQIDHLLINRCLDAFVLESKNYYYGVKINEEGEFLVWDGKTYQSIESPYEQNRRHIQVLGMIFDDRKLAPLRLGLAIPMSYRNVILISPTSKLIKPISAPFDLSTVIKADTFDSFRDKEIDKMSVVNTFATATKIISCETLLALGRKLVKLHKPGTIDYKAKFGITEQPTLAKVKSVVQESPAPQYTGAAACQECGTEVDKKVVFFCKLKKDKFKGRILCRECQQIPDIEPEA